MLSNQYMHFFIEKINRCLENTKKRFPELEIVDFLVYYPDYDGRIFEPLDKDFIILPNRSTTPQPSFNDFFKNQELPSLVRISPFGIKSKILIIETLKCDYISEIKSKHLNEVFLLLGPAIQTNLTHLHSSSKSTLDISPNAEYRLEDIILSDIDSDFVYDSLNLAGKDKDLKLKIIYKLIRSIGTGCMFTKNFIDDYKRTLQDETDTDVLVTLIHLCATADFTDSLALLSPYISHKEVDIRAACYCSLADVSGAKDYKDLLTKALHEEKELSARFCLLKIICFLFRDEADFIKETISELKLSIRESNFLARNGF